MGGKEPAQLVVKVAKDHFVDPRLEKGVKKRHGVTAARNTEEVALARRKAGI
jgi:hypothetical protein